MSNRSHKGHSADRHDLARDESVQLDLKHLVARLIDEELTGEGADRLVGLLSNIPENRAEYIRAMMMHSMLLWREGAATPSALGKLDRDAIAHLIGEGLIGEVGASDASINSNMSDNQTTPLKSDPLKTADQPSRNQRHQPRGAGPQLLRRVPKSWVGGLVAAAMLLVAGLWFYRVGLQEEAWVATIIDSVDARWSAKGTSIAGGAQLPAGKYRLVNGLAQLNLSSGVQIVLQSPSEIELSSANHVLLHSGSLVAKVPPCAIGFTVNTRSAKVIDLGTEFGIESTEGHSLIEVFDGEVEVRPLTSTGSADGGVRLSEGELVKVREDSSVVEQITSGLVQFARHLPEVSRPRGFHVPDEYAEEVRRDGPIVYWRFDNNRSGKVKNEMGDRYMGVIRDADHGADGTGNGSLDLRFPELDRHVICNEPIQEMMGDNYSAELWVSPDRYHLGSVFGLMVGQKQQSRSNVVRGFCIELQPFELPSDIDFPAKRIRFVHRSQPISGRRVPSSVFTTEPYQLAWQHLVAVKERSTMRLYVNGEIAASSVHYDPFPAPPTILAGRLRSDDDDREFIGQLDELALYDRALTANEVKSHYQIVQRALD